MKNLFFTLAVLLTVSSCKVNQQVTDFYKTHCPESKVVKLLDGKYRVILKCSGLYNTVEIKKYVSEGKITFDFTNAELSGVVVSADSVPNMVNILKGIAKGVK